MENLDLAHFYLSREESRDMIEFLAKKKRLRTINVNLAINYCRL